jgi:hypothetical protein
MLTERSLVEIVKQALRAHDAQEYECLKADGSLDAFAKLRAEAALETRDELQHIAQDEAATSNLEYLERVRRHMMRNRQADEIAIAQATEFEAYD